MDQHRLTLSQRKASHSRLAKSPSTCSITLSHDLRVPADSAVIQAAMAAVLRNGPASNLGVDVVAG